MRLSGGGYTIIEVMIFLAISSLLFVAAMIAIGGQQAHTEFSTAVSDVNTKFQQWIDQVVNGFSASNAGPSASTFRCTASGGSAPVLSSGAVARGSNADCIFLGKAIQITDNDSGLSGPAQNPRKIYAYSVLGSRINAGQDVVSSLANAAPAAAVFPSVGGDLTEEYTIPNGARVKWVKDGQDLQHLNTPGSHLAGFFTSFNTGASTLQNGSQSLLSVQYPYKNNADSRDGLVLKCISLGSNCSAAGLNPANPWPLNQWTICLESTRNSDTAAINIISTNGNGAATKVTVPCPGS